MAPAPEAAGSDATATGAPPRRPRASRRARVLALVLALALLEVGAKVVLFADLNGVLTSVEASAARRILWARDFGPRHLRAGGDGGGDDRATRYAMDRHDPTTGWTLREGLVARPAHPVTTTSRGIRSLHEHPLPKPRPRIVVIGDSFTFGEKVADEHTYAHVLDRNLKGIDVLNLGVHGFAHDQILLRLEGLGLSYEPDLVLLGFVSIDMVRNLLDFRDFAKPRYDLVGDGPGAELVLRNVPVATPAAMLWREPFRPHLLDLVSILRARAREASGARFEDEKRITTALVRRMRDVSEGAGARFAMVYLPWGEQLTGDEPDVHQDYFHALAEAEGIEALDVRPAFRRAATQGQRFRPGHWGPAGHLVVARGIVAQLRHSHRDLLAEGRRAFRAERAAARAAGGAGSAAAGPTPSRQPPGAGPPSPCVRVHARLASVDGLEVELDEPDGPGSTCGLRASGSRPALGPGPMPDELVRETLAEEGWQEDPRAAADGPDGTAAAFTAGPTRCRLSARWDGGDDSDPELAPGDRYELAVVCGDDP